MLSSTSAFGNRVYALSKEKSLPELLEESTKNIKKALKDHTLELVQGFVFAGGSGKVRVSRDGRYIGVCGTYPPELRVADNAELSLKFQRRCDAEIVDFHFLSNDYQRIALMLDDRYIEFHDSGGKIGKVRIPKVGRALGFISDYAELVVPTSGPEIYRLNLHTGTFLDPFLSSMTENFAITTNGYLNTCVVGGRGGFELWDPRVGEEIPTASVQFSSHESVTAIDSSPDVYRLAVGTDSGVVNIYDLRFLSVNKPVFQKQHFIDDNVGIRDLKFVHANTEIGLELSVVSADSNNVRIWRSSNGGSAAEDIAGFETQGRVNSIAHYPGSGLIMVAQDFKRVGMNFVPALGIAPTWAPFLDYLIEEMEDRLFMEEEGAREGGIGGGSAGSSSGLGGATFFGDFVFLTRDETEKLRARAQDLSKSPARPGRGGSTEWTEGILDSSALRPHLHGYLLKKDVWYRFCSADAAAKRRHAQALAQAQADDDSDGRITDTDSSDSSDHSDHSDHSDSEAETENKKSKEAGKKQIGKQVGKEVVAELVRETVSKTVARNRASGRETATKDARKSAKIQILSDPRLPALIKATKGH